MQVKETLSYSFYSSKLNKNKYEEFLNKALAIREFKNLLSQEISNHLDKYLNYSKFDFIKYFGKLKNNPFTFSSLIRGNELQKAVIDVFTSYKNKFDAIVRKITFSIQKDVKISYYKRKCKNHEKGELKEYRITKTGTKLAKVLSYLAKFYNNGLDDYLNSLETKNPLHLDILYYLDKFGQRLIELALERRANVIKKYSTPIEFKTLTYRTAIQTKYFYIVQEKNKTKYSNCYVVIPTINGAGSRKLIVPSKIHSKYHGKCKDFISQEYVVKVEKKRVRFILTKEVERDYFVGGEEFLGVDTNLKHNLFSLSVNEEIDLDRKLLRDYTNFLRKLDTKKILTEGEEKQKDLWQIRFGNHIKRKASELVNRAISLGKNHIVMEDLSLQDKTFIRNTEISGFKYSRLTRLLHISSLNKIVKSICIHKGIQFTTIPSHYTSQTCSKCGTIERENRPNQETFSCISCGETRNADFNASINIALTGAYEIFSFYEAQKGEDFEKVSRSLLIEENKNTKWFEAKTIFKKDFVKNHLVTIIMSEAFQLKRTKLLQELALPNECNKMQSLT